jgi:hypothetical protein
LASTHDAVFPHPVRDILSRLFNVSVFGRGSILPITDCADAVLMFLWELLIQFPTCLNMTLADFDG